LKLFINSAKENWVVDRFRKEWNEYGSIPSLRTSNNADLIWIIAPWTWKKLSKRKLSKSKVLCTIHHIDEDKFQKAELENFMQRDKYVDYYHVISEKTLQQVKKLTSKPIKSIPFWVNGNLWFNIPDKQELKLKYNIDSKSFLVGSFQRDTEGSDLVSPKLSKGPDRLVEIFKYLYSENKNTLILLAGKRREYILQKCQEEGIPTLYFEMIDYSSLNELYNLLDLYIVASRYEGGPQAILECAISKTPIISTDVGISSEILHPDSLFDMSNYQSAKVDIDHSYENVLKYKMPEHFEKFNSLLEEVYES
jgi:glycosyltransferase involved in cell wall biosynthesis